MAEPMSSSKILIEAKNYYIIAKDIFNSFDYSIHQNLSYTKIISDWPVTKSTLISNKLCDVENKIYNREGNARYIGFYVDGILQYGYSDSKKTAKFMEEIYIHETNKTIKYRKNTNQYGRTTYGIIVSFILGDRIISEVRLSHGMEFELHNFSYNEAGTLVSLESIFEYKVSDEIRIEKQKVIDYEKEKCIVEKIESKIIKKLDFEQKELLFPWDEI